MDTGPRNVREPSGAGERTEGVQIAAPDSKWGTLWVCTTVVPEGVPEGDVGARLSERLRFRRGMCDRPKTRGRRNNA